MRVVLRQKETGLYLQPNGVWSPKRNSARQFENAVAAYWWAFEQGLQGTEVWLALDDTKKDFVCLTVQSGSIHPAINCKHSGWHQTLYAHLFNGVEIDLKNFDYSRHGELCEVLARAFMMEFRLGRDPQARTAHFRKKQDSPISRTNKRKAKTN
jgi:hypothetical protein